MRNDWRVVAAWMVFVAGCETAPAVVADDDDDDPPAEQGLAPGGQDGEDAEPENDDPLDLNLRGDWEGEIECPAGNAYFALFMPDEDDGSYRGDGVYAFDFEGYYYEVWFTAFVEHDPVLDEDEALELDLEADDCDEIDLGSWACERYEDVTWTPGEGTIEGDIPDFLGLGDDCWFTLAEG